MKTTSYWKNIFQNENRNTIIGFVCTNIMKFPKTTFVTDCVFSNNFFENVCKIIFGREVIHHLHITWQIIGYAHSFCNQKVRANKTK